MSAQDPLGAVSAPAHRMPAPDWSAFENNGLNPPVLAVSVDPLDPLDAPPPPSSASATSPNPPLGAAAAASMNAFAAYRSAPVSEVGDLDYQDMHMPPSYATTATSNGQQQRHQQQLRLNTHYAHHSGAYSTSASPVVEQMAHFAMRTPHQQPAPGSTTTSPLMYTVPHPQTPMSAMGPPQSPMHAHTMQQHMHSHSHAMNQVHQRQMSGVLHTHHPSHSIESFHEIMPPTAGTPTQWGDWTHPDPFGAPSGAEAVLQDGSGAMSGAVGPLARHGHHAHAMSVSMANAYHGV